MPHSTTPLPSHNAAGAAGDGDSTDAVGSAQDVAKTAGADRRASLATGLGRYARMVEIRAAEDSIADLFASGAVHGTTHLCQGQEALAVGLASSIRTDDVVTGTYRGHGIALALGMEPVAMFAEIMGRDGGCTGGVGGSMHLCDLDTGLLPTFAIVGAGLPVAVGAALAFQTRGEDRVAVAVFGDGATNIGAFHESLNLASVWKLPVVFVCDNNVYGEYSRWNVTTPLEDLHERASSYRMRSGKIDGMDLAEVRDAVRDAAAFARSGGGPVLLEAKTYRFAGHSRADAAPYRPTGEVEAWLARDPLALGRQALLDSGSCDAIEITNIEEHARDGIQRALDEATAMESAPAQAIFRNIWTTPPGRRTHTTGQ